jgi:xylulokinase
VQASEIRLAGGGVLHESWRNLLAEVIGRLLGLLHSSVVPNASARGTALLAGLACGAYASGEVTLLIAPEVQETMLPRADERYEAAYARFRELYPRLRDM